MNSARREALRKGSGITLSALLAAVGWPLPSLARAEDWNKRAFETQSMDETLKALGATPPASSSEVTFVATPDIAENGAVVPIGIQSNVAKTESIAILIEKNPNMLAAVFDIPAETEPVISTRVKMAQTSNVYA